MQVTTINRRASTLTLVVCLALLACLVKAVTEKAGAPRRYDRGSVAGLPGVPFAIADFDGDQRPDLATIQVVNDSARASRYSIQFHLSAGPESVVGITAPFGGLRILARDVNGDNFADLIVATAIDSRLVAILVNDGRGNFREAEPGEYPGVEVGVNVNLVAPSERFGNDGNVIPSKFIGGLDADLTGGFQPQIGADSAPWREQTRLFSFPLQIPVGRAPPESVLLAYILS